MNAKILAIGITVLAAVLTSVGVMAEKPDWSGGGRGGGGNQDKGDLFGDLYEIDRTVDGIPVLSENGFVQPIIFVEPEAACPEGMEPVISPSAYVGEACLIPLNEEGEVDEAYAEYPVEVDFGRTNIARAPHEVLEASLEEALSTLTVEGGVLSLDPAGRLVVTFDDPDLGTVVKTIDSPLENLAIYQELMIEGELVFEDETIELPSPSGQDYLDTAAAALGGAADKEGEVTIDMVVYLNEFLAIPDEAEEPLVADGEEYFDFRGFAYTRSVTYDGTVCWLKVIEPVVGEDNLFVVEVAIDPILEVVFGNLDYTGENVAAFTQAADDARAVIEFAHSHPVPEELLEYCN